MNLIPISDLCSRISSGGTPSRKRDEFFSPANNRGHLWVKSKELLDSPIATSEETITDEGLKKSAAKYFPAHTVLVAMYGANVGQLGWLANPATVNQAICGLVADETKADWRYLFYALLQERAKLITKAQGAAQQNLNQDAIRNFELPVPNLPTQRKIADILSAYDDLIENNLRRIKILEQMAQSLYREWFVHFRFPGHESATFKDSELGRIPEGWEVGRLEDVLVLQRGFDLAKDKREVGEIPIYAASGITGYHSEAKVKGPGIVTGRSGTIGQVVYIHEDFWPLNTALWVKAFPKSEPMYAYFLLSAIDLKGFNSGAAVPTLNRNDIHSLASLIPPMGIQSKFQDIAGSMLAEAKTLTLANQNLRRTRDLLLPQLLACKQQANRQIANSI
jgi:type I restriction enzyme S subunit